MIFTSVARLVIGLENAPVARARWQSNSEITSVVDFTPATCVCHRHPVSEPRLFDSRPASIFDRSHAFCPVNRMTKCSRKIYFPCCFSPAFQRCVTILSKHFCHANFFFIWLLSRCRWRVRSVYVDGYDWWDRDFSLSVNLCLFEKNKISRDVVGLTLLITKFKINFVWMTFINFY